MRIILNYNEEDRPILEYQALGWSIKCAFTIPGFTLSITEPCLDVNRNKQKHREQNQSSLEPMCLRGRREFSQPSEEFLKLVMVMDKEAWVSYMLPSPACYWFSMPAFPLAGICQGFLRTCIYVNGLGNYAMTSIACVILHHSLAFFPCPDTLNNCYPDCSSTIVDCSQHKFATGGNPR